MNKVISILMVFIITTTCYGQSFNVRSIFNSGATAGIEYLTPSAINDSTNFQLTKYKVQFVKVLRTKQVDLEHFNRENEEAKANQLFLTSKFSLAKPSLSTDNYFEDIYRGELELTYISVSNKKGLWIHALNVSAEENQTTLKNSFSPNFRAYSVYIHVKNLNFIPFVGPGISINQGKYYVLPVFGFRAKLSPKLAAEFIVPVHVKLKYNLSEMVDLELASYYSAVNAIYRRGSYYTDDDNTLNLKQLKTYFAVNTKLSTYSKFKVELGYAVLQKIDALSTDYSQKLSPMLYCNLSFNYNFGNSILYKYFNPKYKIQNPKSIIEKD